MKIVVYSANLGNYDNFIDHEPIEGVDFIYFSDNPIESKTWEHRFVVVPGSYDNTSMARMIKALPSFFLPDYQFSLWIDGTIKLHADPKALVKEYLKDHDMAVFHHPERKRLMDEAAEITRLKKADGSKVARQMETYFEGDFNGQVFLPATGVLLRRNNSTVERFNMKWWQEMSAHTWRDQLSFGYACWTSNVIPAKFPGSIRDCEICTQEGRHGRRHKRP